MGIEIPSPRQPSPSSHFLLPSFSLFCFLRLLILPIPKSSDSPAVESLWIAVSYRSPVKCVPVCQTISGTPLKLKLCIFVSCTMTRLYLYRSCDLQIKPCKNWPILRLQKYPGIKRLWGSRRISFWPCPPLPSMQSATMHTHTCTHVYIYYCVA